MVIIAPYLVRLLSLYQIERLKKLRSKRDDERLKKTLSDLKKGAEGSENLMPLILEAVKAYATLGDVCDVLRDVFGEYQQVGTLGR